MKKSGFSAGTALSVLCFLFVFLSSGCGTHYQFAGRAVSPSCKGFTKPNAVPVCSRVLVAVQNPNAVSSGALQILDSALDIHESYDGRTLIYTITGYNGGLPTYIQNDPEQQEGFVLTSNGVFQPINYATESANAAISGLPGGGSSSIYISPDQRYLYAANQQANYLTVQDRQQNIDDVLNVPNVNRVSSNPGATAALAFVINTNSVYRVLHLENGQTRPANALDCQPLSLPTYCVLPVPGQFDHPTNAYFSPDGQTAFVLNCGPECGGTQASVSVIPIASIQRETYPTGDLSASPVTNTIPVAGGATAAISDGTNLYVAGQQLQPDGLFAGRLTVISLATQQVIGTYSISDGNHGRMRFADDNTLWIGSTLCATGEAWAKAAPGQGPSCLTMFNTATSTPLILPTWYGDLTGIAAITGYHKIYVAEGGQVHAYNTTDGSERDNTNIIVAGTAYDVAYMDALSNNAD